jgi:hypothetical protein
MIIRNLGTVASTEARVHSATVSWEDRGYPDQELIFEIRDGGVEHSPEVEEPCADAFLAACFPLAAVHGEARVRIEGLPCPMLVDSLYAVHAWWTSWGGMPSAAPAIDVPARRRKQSFIGPRRAVSCLSGGVDGLHTLMRNRRLYQQKVTSVKLVEIRD